MIKLGERRKCGNDHLLILKETIQHHKTKENNVYIAFLYVNKEYDKAWLEGTIYALEKNG